MLSELGQVEEDLDDRVHVAGIAQVFQARETGSEHWYELLACLEDFGEGEVEIGLKIHLRDRLLSLDLLAHHDAEWQQMLRKLVIVHVLVAYVAMDGCSSICSYRAEFESNGEAVRLRILDSVIIST